MAAFRQDEPNRTPSDVLVALVTNTLFRVPMIQAAEAKANARQAPVYLYNFPWKAPVDGGIWGAPHAIDIPFAVGTLLAVLLRYKEQSRTDCRFAVLGQAQREARDAHAFRNAG